MKKKLSGNNNFVGYIVILIFIIYITTAIKVIAKPDLNDGDNVSIENTPIALELGIVDCECDQLYLFDQTRKKLSVYNDEGINISNYDFSFVGKVQIIDVNEVDKELTVYYYRIHKYYIIDFSGEVTSIIDDDIGYADDYLEVKNEVGSYKLVNNVFYYSIQQDEDVLFSRMSYMPFILASILIFFGGILGSQKRYRQERVDT